MAWVVFRRGGSTGKRELGWGWVAFKDGAAKVPSPAERERARVRGGRQKLFASGVND
jgi:hypothetical protein